MQRDPISSGDIQPNSGKKRKSEPILFDVRQLAELLQISPSTVRKCDRTGQFPAPIRIGRRVQWRRDEILAWLDAGGPCREKWERLKQARKGGRRD